MSECDPGPVVTSLWALNEVFIGFAGQSVAVDVRCQANAAWRQEGTFGVGEQTGDDRGCRGERLLLVVVV